jgi:hypothetical protein
VSAWRAKPLEKLSEKLFAIGMVTAFAVLVPLFSLIAEIVRVVMENGFSDGLSATLFAAATWRFFFAQTAALATLFVLYFIEIAEGDGKFFGTHIVKCVLRKSL